MTHVKSVDPWFEWTKWNWTNQNENFGGYSDKFHFRRLKYNIIEMGMIHPITTRWRWDKPSDMKLVLVGSQFFARLYVWTGSW